LAAALVWAAAACSAGGPSGGSVARPHSTVSVAGPTTTVGPAASTEPVAPTTVAPTPPVPPVGWLPCGSGLQCGTVAVPLDYAKPDSRVLGIAVERHPATDPVHRVGSLVINPGGPGDSGINDLPAELRILTPALLARFDIVSFDPRGVNRSAPVRCSPSSSGPPAPVPDPVPQDNASQQALVAADRGYAADCQRYAGDELPFVGTVDAARDLDRIRAALGDDRLTFLGHSYGTLLGAIYAEEFPARVRALVLDGAIDPSLSLTDMSQAQAEGFEHSLHAFFSWCAGSAACPWRPSGDPTAALLGLIGRVRAHPLAVGGRELGPGEVYLGVLDTLYAQSFWPSLGRALAAAENGSGAALLGLSDAYQRHGSTNAVDANSAITCLDHPAPTDPASYPGSASRAASTAPVFGPLFAWGALSCAVWPARPTMTPHAVRAPGSAPILVVGTTGDPATPYAWAVHLAAQLSQGVLVGRQGIDHVAYYYSACVRAIDERYLIDGITPPSGTMCSA
jgi:pimeloyl-ACP methyl ester carboxylesterase